MNKVKKIIRYILLNVIGFTTLYFWLIQGNTYGENLGKFLLWVETIMSIIMSFVLTATKKADIPVNSEKDFYVVIIPRWIDGPLDFIRVGSLAITGNFMYATLCVFLYISGIVNRDLMKEINEKIKKGELKK